MTSTVLYQGNLRCLSTHLQSKNSFVTDAPVDNNGKGEAFSPTDTVATGLASCMLTVMGIKAQEMNIDLSGTVATITKTMASSPRRISQIEVQLELKGNCDKKSQQILENVGRTCPVMQSLHPDLKKIVVFNWQ
jgi:uncharacterized OsmC-like protein